MFGASMKNGKRGEDEEDEDEDDMWVICRIKWVHTSTMNVLDDEQRIYI